MNATESLPHVLVSSPRAGRAWRVAAAVLASWAALAGQMAGAQEGGPAAAASLQQARPDWPESDTVLDLLRADAQAAALAQRFQFASHWLPGGASPQAAPPFAGAASAAADQVELLAIYGVGRALQADVSVNGAVWRYQQGRRWPVGVAGADGHPGYDLLSIQLPCVRLRRQESSRVACLRSGGGHD